MGQLLCAPQTGCSYVTIGMTFGAPAWMVRRPAISVVGGSTVFDFISRESEVVILNNSPVFAYVAEAMHHSFAQLGIKHTMSNSIPDGSNATFITFVTHEGGKLLHKYISYNFEQLTTDKQWPPELFERLRGATMVWDYSLENIKVLKAHGINNSYHVPLGYDATMENTISPARSRDMDVIFVGAVNNKRAAKLEQLKSLQQQPPGSGPLRTSFSPAWGTELLQRYMQSKLALNLHYYGGRTILEVHRIIPLVVSKVLVLSEPSDDEWLDTAFAGIVNYTIGDDIRQSVLSILSMNIEHEAERRYQQLLSCCRYTSYIKAALVQPYPWRTPVPS